jgi:hypothetical protein
MPLILPLRGRLIKSGLRIHKRISTPLINSPQQLQLKTLKKLLRRAKETDFGKTYNFSKILESQDIIQAFRQNIPIHDYNSIYEKWWNRLYNEESNVVWPGKIKYFALSSGTSGSSSKYIPVSDAMLRAMRRTSQYMFSQSIKLGLSPSFYSREFLMLGSSTDFIQKGDLLIGDVSGINSSNIPTWFRSFYRPGFEISKIKDWHSRIDAIAKQAADWDICTISGIPSWVQLMLEKVIEHHKLDNIHDLWPNFEVYVSGGVAFGPYRKRFEQLTSKPIITLDTYYTSEGCLACQTRLDNENMPMELVLNNGVFFEFVPFNDDNFQDGNIKPDSKALFIEEVEEGVDYAVLLSTCSGAWRYLLGDTIKFIDKKRAEIKISGRTKQYLSICGEHLSVDNMNEAVENLEKELDLIIPEFTVKALKVNNHFEHHWYLSVDEEVDSEKIAGILDRKLFELNDDYATERKENLLQHIKIHTLPFEVFINWMADHGKMGGQAKFPRVMTDEKYQDWLNFIENYEKQGNHSF